MNRAVVTVQFYVQASSEEAAMALAEQHVRQMNHQEDNGCQLLAVRVQNFGEIIPGKTLYSA